MSSERYPLNGRAFGKYGETSKRVNMVNLISLLENEPGETTPALFMKAFH